MTAVRILRVATGGDGVGRLEDGRTVALGAMFLAPAQELTSDLAIQLGCELDSGPLGPFVKVDGMKQTSVAGVFALMRLLRLSTRNWISASARVCARARCR